MPDDVQRRIIDQVKAAAQASKRAQEKRDDAIREAMQSGVTVTELARALDMNRSRLYQILNASK
jgi:transposase-like protein